MSDMYPGLKKLRHKCTGQDCAGCEERRNRSSRYETSIRTRKSGARRAARIARESA